MAKFNVNVSYDTTMDACLEVEADDEEHAQEIALEMCEAEKAEFSLNDGGNEREYYVTATEQADDDGVKYENESEPSGNYDR
jgi:hypothetical protein